MTKNTTQRLLVGKVKSDKRDKTRTVELSWSHAHPQYGKVVKKTTRCHVHDANNESKEGDLVEIQQTRPISKTKFWELVRIVEKAEQI